MSKADKLKGKLWLKTISARELRTLLELSGAQLMRVRGSHEVWKLGFKRMVLATHSKELKAYQIKQAQEFLYGTQKDES